MLGVLEVLEAGGGEIVESQVDLKVVDMGWLGLFKHVGVLAICCWA